MCRFGTIANAWDLERLDQQLRCALGACCGALIPLFRSPRVPGASHTALLPRLRVYLLFRCLEPHLPAMRNAMREVWQQLLWSRAYQRSYLGEDGARDAMHALMQVRCLGWWEGEERAWDAGPLLCRRHRRMAGLSARVGRHVCSPGVPSRVRIPVVLHRVRTQILAQRVQHGFRPPPALLQRMAHHSSRRFPCTARPVQFFPKRQQRGRARGKQGASHAGV